MAQEIIKYTPENSMKELIGDNNMLLPVISRFDIPFGFGDAPISQVCERNGVETTTFLEVCNLLSGYPFDAKNISLPSLIHYLKSAHTSFFDITFPRIRHHLLDAINYSETDEAAFLLIRFYDDYVKEVRKHMEHENDEIFSYAEKLMEGVSDPDFHIADYGGNHESMSQKLIELKNIFIYHYTHRDTGRLSAALSDIIICEKDLVSHFEVENNLFIPAVERLEKEATKSATKVTALNHDTNKGKDIPEPDILSEREKDILRSLVKGKSNKEIADELFISAHTVATHRRNISAKLNIHSPAGLTIYALTHHIADLDTIL